MENSETIPEKIDISSILEYSLLNDAGYLIPSENFSILSKNKNEGSKIEDVKK